MCATWCGYCGAILSKDSEQGQSDLGDVGEERRKGTGEIEEKRVLKLYLVTCGDGRYESLDEMDMIGEVGLEIVNC